jgi:hypothetical protein
MTAKLVEHTWIHWKTTKHLIGWIKTSDFDVIRETGLTLPLDKITNPCKKYETTLCTRQ